MATSILPGYPNLPEHSYVVTLGEARYRVTLIWRERPASWYMDLHTQDGTELVLGKRLAPGWSPLAGADLGEHAPDGLLYCRGPDNYSRMDLGDTLVLVYVPQEDIDAATTVEASALTFEVA
jgi:hypothetical protein